MPDFFWAWRPATTESNAFWYVIMSCLVLARSAIREEHKRKLEHLSVSKAAPTKRLLGKSNPGRAYGLPPIP